MSATPPEVPDDGEAPDLADLSLDEYADLLAEIDARSEHITEQTGH